MIFEGICLVIYGGIVYCIFANCLPSDPPPKPVLQVQIKIRDMPMSMKDYEQERKAITSATPSFSSLNEFLFSEFTLSRQNIRMILNHVEQMPKQGRVHYDVFPSAELLQVNIYTLLPLVTPPATPPLSPLAYSAASSTASASPVSSSSDPDEWLNVV
jgi:hypothetical protein